LQTIVRCRYSFAIIKEDFTLNRIARGFGIGVGTNNGTIRRELTVKALPTKAVCVTCTRYNAAL
jgi:hypothetical protein